MRTMFCNRLSLGIVAAALCSCSAAATDPYSGAVAGGVGGTAVGAGTGAIIGSVISNGDVGKSALLGAGIGLPVGILAGVAYTNTVQNNKISDNNEMIQANHERIRQQQHELDYLRNDIRDDSSSRAVNPDPESIQYQYRGPSLGNPRR